MSEMNVTFKNPNDVLDFISKVEKQNVIAM